MNRIETARQLVRVGKLAEALDTIINPTIAEFQELFGSRKTRVYCAAGPTETLLYLTKAAAEKEDAITVDAGYAQAFFLKGYVAVERQDIPGAIENISKAIELSPRNPQFLCELANIRQNQEDWAKAMELYARAAESAPVFDCEGDTFHQRRALRGQAFVLVELTRLDEAERLYRRCIELDPADRMAAEELHNIASLRSRTAK